MKSGVCPKCASREVYHRIGSRFPNEMINLNDKFITKSVAPDKYVCGRCGYLEFYVPINEDFQIVRDEWERVSPS